MLLREILRSENFLWLALLDEEAAAGNLSGWYCGLRSHIRSPSECDFNARNDFRRLSLRVRRLQKIANVAEDTATLAYISALLLETLAEITLLVSKRQQQLQGLQAIATCSTFA